MKYLLISTLLTFSAYAGELKLVGKSLLEYSIFKIDVYEISHYRSDDGVHELHLDYKLDVEKKHSQKGWEVGLNPILEKNPELKSKVKWIKEQTVDYASGDKVILRREKDRVQIYKNNNLLAETNDAEIAKLIHAPWIGDFPIDKDIKKELLGDK